jgi:RNA polymerase sigma-70 factor (ECF subfamily)
LAFVAVIQLLPPRQRAVLILRDVLGWSASETASLLEVSVASANSALQRARATLQDQPPERQLERSASELNPEERALLARFIDAHERGDASASAALLREDVRVTMPPRPWCFDGREAVLSLIRTGTGPAGPGDWRLVPTRANRQPTAASYLREWGDSEYRAFKFDVLRIKDGAIAEITTFGPELFPAFGLSLTIGA